MAKGNNQRKNIIQRSAIIRDTMAHSFTVHKTFSNLNWLNRQLVYVEPSTLFPWTDKRYIHAFFDNANLGNIKEAYARVCDNNEINWHTICDIHHIVCKNTIIPGGQFRTSSKILDITVNGMQYRAPNYEKIPFEMQDNIENRIQTHPDPIDSAIKTHIEMILLQPFEDFNKRTARIIMNWVLMRNGYTPIIFNHAADKIAYRNAIANYASGNIKAYNTFMLDCMERTQRDVMNVLNKSLKK